MKMPRRFYFLLCIILILALSLAACSSEPEVNPAAAALQASAPVTNQGESTQPINGGEDPSYWVEEQPRLDEQGAVSVMITLLNLENAYETIDFQVAMNTHSVDLSMDLAALATLSTDTGYAVQAISWDAPAGGHHVTGMLSFPASVEDKPLLSGADKLTLTIVGVDAPERVFVWERGG